MMAHPEISSLYYLFSTRYLEKLTAHRDTSNIDCGIYIGRLIGDAKNCKINIINACHSNQELTFNLLLSSIEEVISLLPKSQRDSIANDLGINITKEEPTKTFLQKHCETVASLTQHITIQTFNVGSCYTSSDINIINTGSAITNCGVEIILNKLLSQHKFTSIKSMLSLDSFSIAWYIPFLVVCFVVIITLALIYRSIRLKYIYGVYI